MRPTLEVALEISECSKPVRDFVLTLQECCEKLTEENGTLTARLNQTSLNSHRPPSSEPFVKPKSLREKSGRKPGGQYGHLGKTLHRFRYADQVVELHADCCAHCGMDISGVKAHGVVKRQVRDIKIQSDTIDYLAEKKTCPYCKQTVTASFPSGASHYLQYGPAISAIMVCLNQGNNVPFDRLSRVCKDIFGIPLSAGTLVNMVEECGISLKDSMRFIKTQLLSAPVLHADETGVRVKGKLHWLHSVSNDQYTYIETHERRGNKATDGIGLLSKFLGTLVHDFWKSYFAYTNCQHALCNVHILRELTGIVDNFHWKWAGNMKSLLVELYNHVKAEGGFLTGKMLADYREQYDAVLAQGQLEDPFVSCGQFPVKRGRVPKTKSQNLWDRMFQYKEDILRFTTDWEIPFENNQAERDLRMSKLYQKVSGGFRSENGNKYFGLIRSYISSAQKQGHSMFDSLLKATSGVPLFAPDPQ